MLAKEKKLRHWWRKWLALGSDGYDADTKKRIGIINTIAALAAVFTIPYIFFYLFYDSQALMIPMLTLTPQVFLYAVTPWFHRYGPNHGAVYFTCLWISFSMVYNYYFGVESGLQYFLLPSATAGVLIYGVNQIRSAMVVMILGFVGFVISDSVFKEPAYFIHVDAFFLNVMYIISLPTSFMFIFGIVYFANLQAKIADDRLKLEYERSEALLYNVLPQSIASELKAKPGKTIAKYHDVVTILFADIVEFTPKASRLSPAQIVEQLNALFSEFDDLTRKHGLEKVKTIGDAFMAAGGMPITQPDHAERVGRLALDMVESVDRFAGIAGEKILLRIGINSGPAVAGVIGNQKLVYDVWGDTVNTAGRMETYCVPRHIQVTTAFVELTRDVFRFERRGVIAVKGKGNVEVWFLKGLLAKGKNTEADQPALLAQDATPPKMAG